MYFMHLKFERRTLGLIALTPPILLVLFVVITYPDTAWRMLSGMAGH
jgi:cytochrome c oxidase subunit IV